MRSLGFEKKTGFFEKFVGEKLKVLVEHRRDPFTGMLKAMSSNYIPVFMDGPDHLKNTIEDVMVTRVSKKLMVYGKSLTFFRKDNQDNGTIE